MGRSKYDHNKRHITLNLDYNKQPWLFYKALFVIFTISNHNFQSKTFIFSFMQIAVTLPDQIHRSECGYRSVTKIRSIRCPRSFFFKTFFQLKKPRGYSKEYMKTNLRRDGESSVNTYPSWDFWGPLIYPNKFLPLDCS